MTRHLLVLAAALACLAAAPPPKPPVKAAAKPAAKPAAAKPAAPKPAPVVAAGPYDAQNPQSLIDLLNAAGAKAQLGRREEDSVLLVVTSTAATFSVQFAGCDRQGRHCQGAQFDSLGPASPSLAQINSYNQTSLNCRIFQDPAGKSHIIYSALLLKSDTRQSAETHLAAWQGCLAEGRDFLRDPVAYLANAA